MSKAYEFQQNDLKLMKDHFKNDLVIPNTCAKSFDHNQFPSIPIVLDDNILKLLKKHRSKKKSIMHKPDIGVIQYELLDRLWLNGTCYEKKDASGWRELFFRDLESSEKLFNKKGEGFLISIFDTTVEKKLRTEVENLV